MLEKTRKDLDNFEKQKRILQHQIQKEEDDKLMMEQKYHDQKTEISEKKLIYEKVKKDYFNILLK